MERFTEVLGELYFKSLHGRRTVIPEEKRESNKDDESTDDGRGATNGPSSVFCTTILSVFFFPTCSFSDRTYESI